jgi:dephospho-CoA kinase
MTKIIGLTGGIGSGKTTVANYFKELGIPVYIADVEGKKITESPKILKSIKDAFGSAVFDEERLNRQKVSQIVFNDSEKLKQLNSIIHPEVEKHFMNWVNNHSNFPLVVKETALLFESGSYKKCDFVITVIAPLEDRINRVIKRDAITRENVLKRIDNQWSDEDRIRNSHYIIDNTDRKTIERQVKEILKKITIQ